MKIDQVAVQLYTLRDKLTSAEAYADALDKVRQIGFRSVQVSGPRPIEPQEIAALCADKGLVINSTHENSNLILDDPHQVVLNLEAFGCKYTAYPFPSGVDFTDASSVDSMITRLDAAGSVLAAAGKVLTYHNHNHEFRKLGEQVILERIFANTDPKRVQAEIDTYWVQMGGANPVDWCARLCGRLPLLHLKDFKVSDTNQPVFAEIGAGNLDFKAIIAAAETAGCRWFIVEQDVCPGDPFASLEQSFRYIHDHLVERD
jgi:sugar phosphate isomerase/epimerase